METAPKQPTEAMSPPLFENELIVFGRLMMQCKTSIIVVSTEVKFPSLAVVIWLRAPVAMALSSTCIAKFLLELVVGNQNVVNGFLVINLIPV